MFANSEMKEILAKWLEPACEFKSEVYQLQILESRMQEQLLLQQSKKQVKESQCFLRSTSIALPRLELNVGPPRVEDFLPSTSCAAIGNTQSRGATTLDKNLGIIISLASPPPSPPHYPPPPSPPLPSPSPPRSPSPLPPGLASPSSSTSPPPSPDSPILPPYYPVTPPYSPDSPTPDSPPLPPDSPPVSPPLPDSPPPPSPPPFWM